MKTTHYLATQAERGLDAEKDRIARDNLVRKINAGRMAIQHAADAPLALHRLRQRPHPQSLPAPARPAVQWVIVFP